MVSTNCREFLWAMVPLATDVVSFLGKHLAVVFILCWMLQILVYCSATSVCLFLVDLVPSSVGCLVDVEASCCAYGVVFVV